MKKILTPKSSPHQTATLRATLKRLVLKHHKDVTRLRAERVEVREAWALSGGRVKVRVELQLEDGSHRGFTRDVPFTLPPELRRSYRDWTIITKSTWYG